VGVHQFVHIGKLAMVGGMTRIQRDVPPYTIVEGNPARVRSLNLVGLKRAEFASSEFAALKEAYRILYSSQQTLQQALAELEQSASTEQVIHLQNFLQASIAAPRRGPIPGRTHDRRDNE
jgi:UDP-N-acetylglucosamine acyltransferase